MLMKFFSKNPILLIGIVSMSIFLFQAQKNGVFEERREILKATSCRANLVKLKKRVPKSWTVTCLNNNLTIQYDQEVPDNAKFKNLQNYNALVFREMANNLVHTSKNSAEDNLEKTNYVVLRSISPKLIVEAVTFGKDLAVLGKIKDKSLILTHIKKTVKIKQMAK